ncbi:MAG: sugar phosphate nucleotidyltransferase [Candidatus Micrarchaeaceae archaeon]
MPRERISIMLDSDLISRLDSLVDGVEIRNRSHAVERLLDETLRQHEPKRALVFAGGGKVRFGNRRAVKPMVTILGKPILEYLLAELKRNGIFNVTLAVGKESEEIRNYFNDGSKFGIRLSYAKEAEPLGTEGALANTLGLMGDAPFFAINGDCLFRMEMMGMYLQHIETKALVTVALTTMTGPLTNALSYENFGVTKLEGFRIVEFVENPRRLEGTELFSAGIYVIDPRVADYISIPREKTMLEESLFPKLARQGKLYAFLHSGPWHSLDNDRSIETSIAKFAKIILENNMSGL